MGQATGNMYKLWSRRVKIVPKQEGGFINHTSKMLYTLEDIQEACIKLGFDNEKMFDELTGFPSGKDKCIGILEE